MILKHLLPEDDKHTVISSRMRVEIIPESLLTMRIPCHGKSSPCKVFFKYLGLKEETLDPNHQDLEVYVSQEETMPTEEKC